MRWLVAIRLCIALVATTLLLTALHAPDNLSDWNGTASAQAQGICERTPQVQEAIMAAASVTDCAAVTDTHLTSVLDIDLSRQNLRELRDGDFVGLTNLRSLVLSRNRLKTLANVRMSTVGTASDQALYLDFETNPDLIALPTELPGGMLQALLLNGTKVSALPPGLLGRFVQPPTDFSSITLEINGIPLNDAEKQQLVGLRNFGRLKVAGTGLSPAQIMQILTDNATDQDQALHGISVLDVGGNALGRWLTSSTGDIQGFKAALGGLENITSFANNDRTLTTQGLAHILDGFSNFAPDRTSPSSPCGLKVFRLEFGEANLSGLDGSVFSKFKCLISLDLRNSRLDAADLMSLIANLPSTVETPDPDTEVQKADLCTNSSDTTMVPSDASSIHKLILNANDFSGLGSANADFSRLVCLDSLEVQNAEIDNAGLKEIIANLPAPATIFLRLYLQGNQVTDISDVDFNRLRHVIRLFLDNNKIARIRTDQFRELSNLQHLYLRNNRINTIELGAFNGLNLYHLLLSGNQLTSIDPMLFQPLGSRLRFLYLHDNPVRMEVTEQAIRGARPGTYVLTLPEVVPVIPTIAPSPSLIPTTVPSPYRTGLILRIEPSVRSVTLSPGESVRLAAKVYGVQDIREDSLADGKTFLWSLDTAPGGSIAGSGREVVYTAPSIPGASFTLTVKVGINDCGGTLEQCMAKFGIKVRHLSEASEPTSVPFNPAGETPSILVDADGSQYEVFSPISGGQFVDDLFSITAGPGAVPSGEIVGLRMDDTGPASNVGMTSHRYGLVGNSYRVSAVSATGASVSGYTLNAPVVVCVPLPPEARANISETAVAVVNPDDTLTLLSARIRIDGSGTAICANLTVLPATLAVGTAGSPLHLPTAIPMSMPEPPQTGGTALHSSIHSAVGALLLGITIATFATILLLLIGHRRKIESSQ